jgi:formylmethanofuran dehydrogenase subunit E
MHNLQELLRKSAASHKHLCPRQVLGVRMGCYAADLLGFDPLRVEKRLLVIVETDGCFATGICAATGASIGSRNLRIEDYGKVAATFTDTRRRTSLRLVPQTGVRVLASECAPAAPDAWQAMLEAYQQIPDEQLFSWQPVELHQSIEAIFSRPGIRTSCTLCGEEIINEREILRDGQVLCRACAGEAYYRQVRGRL